MDNNKKEDFVFPESGFSKLTNYVKNNFDNITLILFCLFYIFNGLFEITPTGMTLEEILYGSALSFFVVTSIKNALGVKGIQVGLNSKEFIKSKTEYEQSRTDVSEISNYCDAYCDRKNSYNQIQSKKIFIESYGLVYKKYIDGSYNKPDEWNKLKKRQQKALKRVKDVRYISINSEYLMAEQTKKSIFTKKEITLNQHIANDKIINYISTVAVSIIFGIYTINPNSQFSWIKCAWYAFQIALWFIFGISKFISNKNYVINDYRLTFEKKKSYLLEFKTMYNKEPKWFEEYEEKRKQSLLEEEKGELEYDTIY